MNVTPHPNGIKPSGNHIDSAYHGRDYFRLLPDEIIYNLLQSLPSPQDVLNLSHTCKKIYAFSLSEELWKEIYTARKSDAPWKGTWRASFLRLEGESKVQVPDTYSDLLFKPYLNSQIDLNAFLPSETGRRKKAAAPIDRYPNMSLADFTAHHTHKPFILTEAVRDWPAMTRWTVDSLLDRFGETVFRAECVDWTLAQYVAYMKDNRDESPLYLFDAYFAQKTTTTRTGNETSLADEYSIPECFSEDAFDLLSPAERPDHRWLIMGPPHSGSTFHKDPNGTCAWNAVVTGAKYWIMFPPSSRPPGVFTSPDESEVTAPESIAEWMLTYHDAALETPGCRTGVCRAGEVLFVPSGWWHLVVNLDEASIAVTQNFVPRTTIGRVLAFLRDRREQVSGFRKDIQAYEIFSERVKHAYPAEWAAAMESRPSKWAQLTKTHDEEVKEDDTSRKQPSTGFTFNFDEESSDDGGNL